VLVFCGGEVGGLRFGGHCVLQYMYMCVGRMSVSIYVLPLLALGVWMDVGLLAWMAILGMQSVLNLQVNHLKICRRLT
jgi:hypothetical protein